MRRTRSFHIVKVQALKVHASGTARRLCAVVVDAGAGAAALLLILLLLLLLLPLLLVPALASACLASPAGPAVKLHLDPSGDWLVLHADAALEDRNA